MGRLALLLVVLTSCGSGDDHVVQVRLRTDYAPSSEFQLVYATMERNIVRMATREVVIGDNYADGVLVAEFEDVTSGNYTLLVALRDSTGANVVSRRVAAEVREDIAITVLISKDCTECMVGDDDASVPPPPNRDGGAMDSGGSDAGPVPCGSVCVVPGRCEVGIMDCNAAMPTCVPNAAAPEGTVCRAVAGDCDIPERCDGTSRDCPADGVVAAGTECRAVAGDCDVAEACDGTSPACPADGFEEASVVCRPSLGQCDAQESCTGETPQCPADEIDPDGTECRPAQCDNDAPELCSSGACPQACGCRGQACCPSAECAGDLVCMSEVCCSTTSPSTSGSAGPFSQPFGGVLPLESVQGQGGSLRFCAGTRCGDVTLTGMTASGSAGPFMMPFSGNAPLTQISGQGPTLRVCAATSCSSIALSGGLSSGSVGPFNQPLGGGSLPLTSATGNGGTIRICATSGSNCGNITISPNVNCED